MQKIGSLNTIEFGHLIQHLLYFLQYILQKYPKTCGHFCCGQSSDNIFWTPHNLKYMAHMQNPDCKTFYVSRTSSPCDIGQSQPRTAAGACAWQQAGAVVHCAYI